MFDKLVESLEQAIDIKNGDIEASKVTVLEIPDTRVIRKNLGVTRKQFSEVLGLSEETIKSWEQKKRNPQGLTRKVLRVIDANPDFYWLLKEI
ncbi:helix-turn-helix domain-containing protein [Vibrio parahaemolyticus]|nr:helix-turn-helix domain-containing protein [Vibrio parahaemolyticus]